MGWRVVVTEELDEDHAAWLAQRAELVWHRFDAPGFEAVLQEAHGLIVRTYTRVDAALLRGAPSLRVVGRAGVGLDNIDVTACRAAGVEVVYTPDANTQAVVEYVLGLMLDRFRPRTDLPPDAGDAEFFGLRRTAVGTELAERTLGIIGFGRIGQRLGRVAATLGMSVLATDVLPEGMLRKAAGDFPWQFCAEDTLLRDSDVITLHADGRVSNHHMIDGPRLARLRDDAVFINAARGFLVDAAALGAWLAVHPRAQAILDVHHPEPPSPDDPLRRLPNVRLLPHLASRTSRAMGNMSGVVADVHRVLLGEEPRFPAP